MFLTGRFTRSLDEKHRLAIPKSLRDCLGKQVERPLYIAPGLDGSLAIYPEATFGRLVERLAVASPAARDVRDYSRLFFSQAEASRIDGQGRLRLPAELVHWATLVDGVILVGVHDRMEVWHPEAWNDYVDQRRERYDEIAEAALGRIEPLAANRPPQ